MSRGLRGMGWTGMNIWDLTMKLMTHKTLFTLLVAFSLAIMVSPLAAQVYKIVDKDGNVTYTDKPPEDDAKPMDLLRRIVP